MAQIRYAYKYVMQQSLQLAYDAKYHTLGCMVTRLQIIYGPCSEFWLFVPLSFLLQEVQDLKPKKVTWVEIPQTWPNWYSWILF